MYVFLNMYFLHSLIQDYVITFFLVEEVYWEKYLEPTKVKAWSMSYLEFFNSED